MILGDYNTIANEEMLHSATDHGYKGIYSSFNKLNNFEISYSLNRQFGSEKCYLYADKHGLFCR